MHLNQYVAQQESGEEAELLLDKHKTLKASWSTWAIARSNPSQDAVHGQNTMQRELLQERE